MDLTQPDQAADMLIEHCGPHLEPAQLYLLESDIEVVFPMDYREFLLSYNGGTPEHDRNIVDVPGAPGSPTDLQVFFGVGRAVHSSDLRWNLELIREHGADTNLIPIACDSGGNLFCLRIGDEGISDVVYCDLDKLNCTCYYVTENFSKFKEALRRF